MIMVKRERNIGSESCQQSCVCDAAVQVGPVMAGYYEKINVFMRRTAAICFAGLLVKVGTPLSAVRCLVPTN